MTAAPEDSLAAVVRARAVLTAPGAPFEAEPGPRGPRYVRGPRTLRELFDATAAHGGRPFLVAGDRTWSFAEHHAAASALAHHWRTVRGLCPGDRVAIAMRNLPEWQVAFWAAQAAGLVAVPLNAWWGPQELARALDDCAPGLIVADAERAARTAGWAAAHGVPLLTVGADGPHDRFEDLPLSGAAAPEPSVGPDDPATLIYTSGTTGRPKGVAASHANWCAGAHTPRFFAAGAALCRGDSPQAAAPPTVLMTFPFFHVAAFTSVFLAMAAGGTAVLMHRWDPDTARELISRHRATIFAGVPTTALGLLDAAEAAGDPLTGLALISTGGAPAPPGLAGRIARQFGSRVEARNGYGLTETCGGVTAQVGARYLARPESIGRPCPAVEVRIADADGAPLPDGRIGELLLRGQPVFGGYRGDPDATAAAFTADGWFRTGDLARVADGEVYVVDRLKDVVIRGGENVYCGEVEGVLLGHPGIADAAVVGVPHPLLGEEVAAVVVARAGAQPDAAEVRAHVASRLAAFKVPAHVVFREGPLPRNPTGKILKQALRQEAGAASPRP
ncbi:class I adenylate-forming enzyme family protein [Streptomyces sp. NRRL B-24484]|uniref:class I adenylate-forming enzyme family protein n=1 Tax=Streptomyces sp. NRRL B-24484 TaxID=1463833 RepID=UPI000693B78F|nr:class I adenylate-forming enzyme family protein [Streptomyces sp. NRRL B-24484]